MKDRMNLRITRTGVDFWSGIEDECIHTAVEVIKAAPLLISCLFGDVDREGPGAVVNEDVVTALFAGDIFLLSGDLKLIGDLGGDASLAFLCLVGVVLLGAGLPIFFNISTIKHNSV